MELTEFFNENPKVAIAFSGGVDSSYLLYAAVSAGAEVIAYYVKSAFQPQFELEDAKRLADCLHAKLRILGIDILKYSDIVKNPSNQCYYCKHEIFTQIRDAALSDGYTTILDGTNASDVEGDRPGMKALKELCVKSPLQECGLTKDEIRKRSRNAGLFTWDKPAYACLATRIKTGEVITAEKLDATEKSEEYLFSLGFRDFRVRRVGNTAKIQLNESDFERLLEYRSEILNELKKYYEAVTLDLEVRNGDIHAR